MKVQTKAQLKHLRMTPQKVRLVAGLVRGLDVNKALEQLQFSSKQAALPVKKLIESAVANAKHNHNVKEETLKVETIFVDEGSVLKRWMPRAMGRATPLRKKSSHITVVLTGEADETKKEVKSAKGGSVFDGKESLSVKGSTDKEKVVEKNKKEVTKKTKK